MEKEERNQFMAEFEAVAKAAEDVASRAKKVPDNDLAPICYLNLVDEVCQKVQGLRRMAMHVDKEYGDGQPRFY